MAPRLLGPWAAGPLGPWTPGQRPWTSGLQGLRAAPRSPRASLRTSGRQKHGRLCWTAGPAGPSEYERMRG
eukprot:5949335-Pyramimonas_sp.AAC.1